MTTQTTSLASWLLARIAEDDAVAKAATPGPWDAVEGASGSWWVGLQNLAHVAVGLRGENARHIARHDPARVLAQCAAYRRIVELHARCDVHDRPGDECDACKACGDGSLWPCETVLALASVYANHPEFREEWR